MSVADYMTPRLVVVSPKTTISVAVELMKKNAIHRLPVMAGNRMVGLITHGLIQRAMPSQATSLSVYELNYLLTYLLRRRWIKSWKRRFKLSQQPLS
ncbi:Acetoin utilization protein [Lactiplantibacillus plantarum]|nr:Acetoin utilization protein [Lactiplantibacillus plantarum]